MPDIDKREKIWAFVEKVSPSLKEVEKGLEPTHYHTQTKGDRTLEGARPVGEGAYAIVEHHGHSHLAYVLELPSEPGEIQDVFHIEKEGSYIISIKNPEAVQPANVGLGMSQKAVFPEDLQKKFEGKKFISVNPVDFLDHQGAEILIIGVSKEVGKLGESGEMLESEERFEYKRLQDDQLYEELKMDKKNTSSTGITWRLDIIY